MLINLQAASICQEERPVLQNVNFKVDDNDFIYIIGKVGSGKSSLMRSLYGDIPLAEGEGTVLDYDLRKLRRKHLPDLRRQLGIVFQDFQLMHEHTVRQNLDFVLRATGWKKKTRLPRIEEVLSAVGLSDKIDSYPHELSGGEQQRICIARALLNNPRIILADEPTGNLDEETSIQIMKLLQGLREQGSAVVMVTHSYTLIQRFPGIVYRCKDGEIHEVTGEYNAPLQIEE